MRSGTRPRPPLYFTALERIDASLVALILYTYPVFVTLAAAVLGRDRLTPARCTALVVASCGTLLVLLGAGGLSVDLLAVALAFGAAVAYTVYVLVADTVVHRMPPLVLSAWVMTGASLALAARAVVTGGLDLGFGPAGWLWIACMAIVSTVVGMFAFFAGLRRTGPSTAAILSTFEPVVTAGLTALALGEFSPRYSSPAACSSCRPLLFCSCGREHAVRCGRPSRSKHWPVGRSHRDYSDLITQPWARRP